MAKVEVILNGGLGNQLFQLAGALSICKDTEMVLNSAAVESRTREQQGMEISGFKLPAKVEISKNFSTSFFVKKLSNLLLRLSTYSVATSKLQEPHRKVLRAVEVVIGIIAYPKAKCIVPYGLGYSKLTAKNLNSAALIGYFQSYKWASNPSVLSELIRLAPKNPSQVFMEFQKLAIEEKPLIVHIRLGDYLKEKSFGVPSNEYFAKALNALWNENMHGKIWLFSDRPTQAMEMFPHQFSAYVRLVEGAEMTSAENLQLMRHGHGYVISNSTFSWWGAFLTFNKDAKVVAPFPWFTNIREPLDLLPPHWERGAR
jgi:hypothetical protein